MLLAAAFVEIIQSYIARHILPKWVGSAAYETDRLVYRFGAPPSEIWSRFCPLLDRMGSLTPNQL